MSIVPAIAARLSAHERRDPVHRVRRHGDRRARRPRAARGRASSSWSATHRCSTSGAGARELPPRVRLYAKLEGFNPGGSVKDRAALWMVRHGPAQRRAAARQDDHRLDLRQHRHRPGHDRRRARLSGQLVMPENVSVERKKIIRAFGAPSSSQPRPRGLGRRHPRSVAKSLKRTRRVLQARSVLQRANPRRTT